MLQNVEDVCKQHQSLNQEMTRFFFNSLMDTLKNVFIAVQVNMIIRVYQNSNQRYQSISGTVTGKNGRKQYLSSGKRANSWNRQQVPGKGVIDCKRGKPCCQSLTDSAENLLSVIDGKRATESGVRGSKSRTEQTPVTFDWNRTALETSPFSSVFVLFCCD